MVKCVVTGLMNEPGHEEGYKQLEVGRESALPQPQLFSDEITMNCHHSPQRLVPDTALYKIIFR